MWGSDGDQAPLIQQTQPWDAAVAWDPVAYQATKGGANWPTLKMEGNPVFKWASYTMAKTAAEALDAAGVRARTLTSLLHIRRTCESPMPCSALSSSRAASLLRANRTAGQYLGRLDSVGHRGVARVRAGAQGPDLPHHRLRRRPGLRRSGDHPALAVVSDRRTRSMLAHRHENHPNTTEWSPIDAHHRGSPRRSRRDRQ